MSKPKMTKDENGNPLKQPKFVKQINFEVAIEDWRLLTLYCASKKTTVSAWVRSILAPEIQQIKTEIPESSWKSIT